MKTFKAVSIVVPAIDETDSLRESVEIILSTCAHEDLAEFFFAVCERTTPDCLSIINSYISGDCGVPCRLYYQKGPGLGSALHEAMQRVRGSHVVNIAADMDTDPRVVKDMIAVAKEHPDAIILASRWVRGGGFDGYGRVNKALNFIFNKMLQVLFWTKVKDLTYGYRFAPVDKTLSVKWESTGFSIGMETNLRMLRLGYPIIEVPAMWRVRKQGDSQNSFFTKCKYINTVLKVRFARKDSNKSAEPRES
ncbi:MAG TPA: glycosyltransferase [Clostridiales bacterium]|nr:MAG: Glycosyl transferase family 2 [Firmicutes bacterium ADurb.Bin262]HOU10276.1 glycosyltransferase [Clostridiales bacterium]HQH62170.1 glycosyltransferase [Clostridiales bacterium]HQK73500.1 glycosyltransferase [Clostridiales bacterium]